MMNMCLVYLTLPREVTSVQLVMSFGAVATTRYWRIQISLLPCGTDYLGSLHLFMV